MTTSHETAYLGDDVIELDCEITEHTEIYEVMGFDRHVKETDLEIQTIRIYGFDVKGLPADLVETLKKEAIEQLLG